MERESVGEGTFHPVSNERGRSVTIATRVTPELNVTIERIVENPGTPWQTKAEFLRDATGRYAQQVAEDLRHDTLLPQVLRVVRRMQVHNFRKEVHQRLVTTVRDAADEVVLYLRARETERLGAEFEEVADMVLAIDDPFWRREATLTFFLVEDVREAARVLEALPPGGHYPGPSSTALLAYWREIEGVNRGR